MRSPSSSTGSMGAVSGVGGDGEAGVTLCTPS
jgi:hypothetical protein